MASWGTERSIERSMVRASNLNDKIDDHYDHYDKDELGDDSESVEDDDSDNELWENQATSHHNRLEDPPPSFPHVCKYFWTVKDLQRSSCTIDFESFKGKSAKLADYDKRQDKRQVKETSAKVKRKASGGKKFGGFRRKFARKKK